MTRLAATTVRAVAATAVFGRVAGVFRAVAAVASPPACRGAAGPAQERRS